MTPPTELRGAVLGRGYRLGQAVAGEDAVFEATHERVPGKVVVRLFPNESLARPDAAARIHQAVRLASLLRVPNAVQLLDFNLAGDTPAFVVTERVQGRTLAAVMAEDGMLSLPATVEIVDAIAAAVQAAHRLGLTHGDLRAPLIVVPDGGGARAKVGGFGWAKELRAAAVHPARPGLLAPEQHGGRVVTIDPRADQYGLAALAYEMLAACPPFPEDPTHAGQETRLPTPLGELVPELPHALDDVLQRALSQRPRERFEDIAEFAARLRQAAASAPITVPLSALPALAVPQPPPNGSRNGARRSGAPPLPSSIPSAMPSSSSAMDITEEMDNQTLWPLVAKADSGGTISSRIQREDSLDIDLLGHVAREKGYGSDLELNIDIASSDTAHALPGERHFMRDAAAIAEMLDSSPTPPPEVATAVQQSPFILPAVRAEAEAETPPPVTPPPQPAVPSAMPRRPSAPYPTVPTEFPRRPSAPHATVPAAFPRPPSAPIAAAPAELPRRPSAPYPTVPPELPRRPSAPHATVPAAPPASTWPTAAPSPGPYPVQPVIAPQDRYFVQPVEINLDPPSAPTWVRPNGQARASGYGAHQPFPTYGAPGHAFGNDADFSSPSGLRSGRLKPAVAAVLVVGVALAAGVMLKSRLPFAVGRGAEPQPALTEATVPASGAATAGSTSPIIAPVQTETVDPASNGQGDCAVRITSTPAAVVLIDGKDTGHHTPLLGFRVTCGLHRLLLRHPDTGLQRGDIMKVIPGHPYTGNYTFGPTTLAPAPEAAVDSTPARPDMHLAVRRHSHRKRHRPPRTPAVYVDEFE